MLQLRLNKGVTLIESLMAMALVGIALVTLLATFTIGRTISGGMTNRIVVINKLRETMEDIKGLVNYGAITSVNYGNWTINDNGTPADATDDIVSTAFFTNVVNENGCRRITLTMAWTENRGGTPVNMQESLETYIADHWW